MLLKLIEHPSIQKEQSWFRRSKKKLTVIKRILENDSEIGK